MWCPIEDLFLEDFHHEHSINWSKDIKAAPASSDLVQSLAGKKGCSLQM